MTNNAQPLVFLAFSFKPGIGTVEGMGMWDSFLNTFDDELMTN